MEKICIKNMNIYYHSFENMKPQLCFILKKPSLVNNNNYHKICFETIFKFVSSYVTVKTIFISF